MIKIKALIFGIALSAIMPIAVIALFNVRWAAEEPSAPNLPLLLLGWAVAFFLPSFCAAYIARRSGWLYGLFLGLLTTGIAWSAHYQGPVMIIAACLAIAIVGGLIGQKVSNAKHAH